jgi:hypothetical protein
VQSAGGFRCLEDINRGPLNGCKAGEGVRWDTVQVLESFQFKCTGAAGEKLKTVRTDDNTVVLFADFYRQGDGNNESFTAHMFVSEVDEADDIPRIQNVWIEQVGCGHAIANFNYYRGPNLMLTPGCSRARSAAESRAAVTRPVTFFTPDSTC